MENRLAYQADSSLVESVVIGGDLSRLSPEQRVSYYKAVCDSTGLNPLTRPFDYITLNGKLTLYARKDAADQLRKLHDVSIDDIDITENDTHFIVKVKGHDKTGRSDVEIGVVAKTDMAGNLGNAQMKAVTKSKRRLTLSLCGLGMLDETEIETIPTAVQTIVDEKGEIVHDAEPAPVVPLDNVPEMSLEMAESEVNSKGVKYGELSTSTLSFMFKAISGKERTDELSRKLVAIQTILRSRSAGSAA